MEFDRRRRRSFLGLVEVEGLEVEGREAPVFSARRSRSSSERASGEEAREWALVREEVGGREEGKGDGCQLSSIRGRRAAPIRGRSEVGARSMQSLSEECRELRVPSRRCTSP